MPAARLVARARPRRAGGARPAAPRGSPSGRPRSGRADAGRGRDRRRSRRRPLSSASASPSGESCERSPRAGAPRPRSRAAASPGRSREAVEPAGEARSSTGRRAVGPGAGAARSPSGPTPAASSRSAKGLPALSATRRSATSSRGRPGLRATRARLRGRPPRSIVVMPGRSNSPVRAASSMPIGTSCSRRSRSGARRRTRRPAIARRRPGPAPAVRGRGPQQRRGPHGQHEAVAAGPSASANATCSAPAAGRGLVEPPEQRHADLGEPGEGELHLGLDARRPQTCGRPACRRPREQRRLADPRLALERERRATAGPDLPELCRDARHLAAPSDQGRHAACLMRVIPFPPCRGRGR